MLCQRWVGHVLHSLLAASMCDDDWMELDNTQHHDACNATRRQWIISLNWVWFVYQNSQTQQIRLENLCACWLFLLEFFCMLKREFISDAKTLKTSWYSQHARVEEEKEEQLKNRERILSFSILVFSSPLPAWWWVNNFVGHFCSWFNLERQSEVQTSILYF